MPRRKPRRRRSSAATPEPEPEPAGCVACSAVPPTRRDPTQIDTEAYLFQRIFSHAVCSDLIRMSHERTFSLDLEHVDDKPVYQIDLVQNGWVADVGMWLIIGPPFDRHLKPLLGELPWLKGTAFTLDFAFMKR